MTRKTSEAFKKRIAAEFSGGIPSDFLSRSGLSWQTVKRWIDGERVPDLEQLEKAAHGLGLTDPLALLSTTEEEPWARVPEPILVALAQVHPDHYPIVANFLESFTVQREASKLSKSLEKPRPGHKKRSK